jgi:hypothetical protein
MNYDENEKKKNNAQKDFPCLCFHSFSGQRMERWTGLFFLYAFS